MQKSLLTFPSNKMGSEKRQQKKQKTKRQQKETTKDNKKYKRQKDKKQQQNKKKEVEIAACKIPCFSLFPPRKWAVKKWNDF